MVNCATEASSSVFIFGVYVFSDDIITLVRVVSLRLYFHLPTAHVQLRTGPEIVSIIRLKLCTC